jgi:glyoxalase family protein
VAGTGETGAVAYGIRPGSIGYWRDRLKRFGIETGEAGERFGAEVIGFKDSDGMRLELIASDEPATIRHWQQGPVPETHSLLGFHSVTLWLQHAGPTGQVLVDQMGYTPDGQEGSRYRYRGASNDRGLYVDLDVRPAQPSGQFGAGSIHHIAFRTVDDEEQVEYQKKIHGAGLGVTEVKDRQYFHSIYFREPGGVLFEIATDAPGFLYDEPVEVLGTSLKLPPWLEKQREDIAARLPALARTSIETFEATFDKEKVNGEVQNG